jgi:hypothetical protein
MAVLTKQQFQILEKLFYDAPALQQAVEELRILRKTDAQDTADPTAKEAVEGLAEIPAAMTYQRPEAWLRVVNNTWNKYHGTQIGDAMCKRYKLRERWTLTVCKLFIADDTYFRWRREFILSAAIFAAREGLL